MRKGKVRVSSSVMDALDIFHRQAVMTTTLNGYKQSASFNHKNMSSTAAEDKIGSLWCPSSTTDASQLALQKLIDTYQMQMLSFLQYMKTQTYQDNLQLEIEKEKERKQNISGVIWNLETEIKNLEKDGKSKIEARMSEMGIVANTPKQLIDEAMTVLKRNRYLESKMFLLQEQLLHLEKQQKELLAAYESGLLPMPSWFNAMKLPGKLPSFQEFLKVDELATKLPSSAMSATVQNGHFVDGLNALKAKQQTKSSKNKRNSVKLNLNGSITSNIGSVRKPTLEERIRSLLSMNLLEDADEKKKFRLNGHNDFDKLLPNLPSNLLLDVKPKDYVKGLNTKKEQNGHNTDNGTLFLDQKDEFVHPQSLMGLKERTSYPNCIISGIGRKNGFRDSKMSPSSHSLLKDSPKLCMETPEQLNSLMVKPWFADRPQESVTNNSQHHFHSDASPPAKRRLFCEGVADVDGIKSVGFFLRPKEMKSNPLLPDTLPAHFLQNGCNGKSDVYNQNDDDCGINGQKFNNQTYCNGVYEDLRLLRFPNASDSNRLNGMTNCSHDVDGLATIANIACLLSTKSPSSAMAPVTPSRAPVPQIGEEAHGLPVKWSDSCSWDQSTRSNVANQQSKFSFTDLVGYASSQLRCTKEVLGSGTSKANRHMLADGSDTKPNDSRPSLKQFRLWRCDSKDSTT